jgi:hypothetical protein
VVLSRPSGDGRDARRAEQRERLLGELHLRATSRLMSSKSTDWRSIVSSLPRAGVGANVAVSFTPHWAEDLVEDETGAQIG